VNIAFHNRRVGAKFAPWRYTLLTRQAHHALMNLFGDLRTQQREGPTEGREIGCGFGIEAGEPPVHQVAAELPFQIAEAPALQVLHDAAAQQTIGGYAGPSGARRSGETCRQTLLNQLEQSGILQELIDGIEQIVLEQSGLQGQRGVEEPGLVGGRVDHDVLDYIE
jgi:hypothetical protein